MPKPNQSRENDYNTSDIQSRNSEHIILETKPNMILYSDNFVLKIIVFFMLIFLFAPVIRLVYGIQDNLLTTFQIQLNNMTFIVELILLFCILLVLIKIGLDIIDWNYTTYTLTRERVIIQRGFFRKEKITMSYGKIQDIEVTQSIIERILNTGNIIIYGGHDNSETILDEVPNPNKVEELIIENINIYNSQSYYPKVRSGYNFRFDKYNNNHSSKGKEVHYYNNNEEYNQDFDENTNYDNQNSNKKRSFTNKLKKKNNYKESKYNENEIISKHQNRFKKYNK